MVMKYIRLFFSLWISAFYLTSCAPKSYSKNESRFILIKSPLLKYADLGYIRSNKDEVRADLFVAGNLVQSIEISHLICVNEGCLTKSAFNEGYLSKAYPDDLLLDILQGHPIFNQASLQVTEIGFRQELKSPDYNIVYKVENGDVSFKDTLNKLKIKILKTKDTSL